MLIMPTVSVVVPTHNRSRMLIQTLDSVCRQRDVEVEIVVVNDGSIDETLDAIARLGDARIRVLDESPPAGVSAARNRGIQSAAGDWIAFLDDDDLWSPDKLRNQLAAARETQ